MRETADRMGEEVETIVTASGTDAFRSKGLKNGSLLLEVTIDDASLSVRTSRGETRPDMTPVIGKSFESVQLAPVGTLKSKEF